MTNIPEATMQEDEATEVVNNPTEEATIIRMTHDILVALLDVLPVWTQKYGAEGARAKVRTMIQIVLSNQSPEEEIEELRKKGDEMDLVPCVVCWNRFNSNHNVGAFMHCLYSPPCS